MGWKEGRRFKKEGTYVYLWLIHVDVWQKPTQYCKASILQLKINKLREEKKAMGLVIALTLGSLSLTQHGSPPCCE